MTQTCAVVILTVINLISYLFGVPTATFKIAITDEHTSEVDHYEWYVESSDGSTINIDYCYGKKECTIFYVGELKGKEDWTVVGNAVKKHTGEVASGATDARFNHSLSLLLRYDGFGIYELHISKGEYWTIMPNEVTTSLNIESRAFTDEDAMKTIQEQGKNVYKIVFDDSIVVNDTILSELIGSINNLFPNVSLIEGLGNVDTSYVTDMSSLFSSMKNIKSLDLTGWDVSNVEYMSSMFADCPNLKEVKLGYWNTSKVQEMIQMFAGDEKLERIYVNDGWTTKGLTSQAGGMFAKCVSLAGERGTKFNAYGVEDESFAHIDGGEKNPGYLSTYIPAVDPEPEVKDESCEKVIGPTWHWNNTKGVCEEVSVVGTYTR